jgi:hypothetical protein
VLSIRFISLNCYCLHAKQLFSKPPLHPLHFELQPTQVGIPTSKNVVLQRQLPLDKNLRLDEVHVTQLLLLDPVHVAQE